MTLKTTKAMGKAHLALESIHSANSSPDRSASLLILLTLRWDSAVSEGGAAADTGGSSSNVLITIDGSRWKARANSYSMGEYAHYFISKKYYE